MYKYHNNPYLHGPLLAADGGAAGGADGDDAGEGDDLDDEFEDGEDGEDPEAKKYTQKDIDEAIKKRLAREKRKWQRGQEKPDPAGKEETETDKKAKAAEERASSLELKIACYEAGVSKEAVDDVTALAKAYMTTDEDLELEDAIEKVVKKYPQFKSSSTKDDEDDDAKGSWGQRQIGKGSKKVDGVEAAFLKRNPNLKLD